SNPLAVAEGTAPVWSPDGSRFAFLTTFVHDCDWQDFCVYFTTGVLVLDLRGGTTANLTRPGSEPPTVSDPGTSSDWSPTWSPDGAKVAFVRDYALYVSNVDGS